MHFLRRTKYLCDAAEAASPVIALFTIEAHMNHSFTFTALAPTYTSIVTALHLKFRIQENSAMETPPEAIDLAVMALIFRDGV